MSALYATLASLHSFTGTSCKFVLIVLLVLIILLVLFGVGEIKSDV